MQTIMAMFSNFNIPTGSPNFDSGAKQGLSKFQLEKPDISKINVSNMAKVDGDISISNPVRATHENFVIPWGKFEGLSFQDLVDTEYSLLHKHLRPLPEPGVCQREDGRCDIPYAFIKWFKMAYRKDLLPCSSLPYYVRVRKVRFPDTDAKFPGKTVQSVWEKNPEYFSTINQSDPNYIAIISLYGSKIKREVVFPKTIRSKKAGLSFDEVGRTDPSYFEWIVSSFSGKEKAYLDAADWWLENRDKYLAQAEVEHEENLVVASSEQIPSDTVYTSGKYKGKSFQAIFDTNPGYYRWLCKDYRGRNPEFLKAIAWYRQTHPDN
jgi:hypothetical protein